ncbi:SDR family oxidoreductase [Herbiconiux moechotypicola]|uniref:SDR family oxidoreductase n=1 Tax=Herbiconiux moechotypicola TaxID=637393 RepID=A0ABN3E9L3_9MICO|nr:SDR family oxidoreductase [Herbiconiux moechotypicola]
MTGAGSGIGQAIARGIATAGANVCLFDLDSDACEATARQIRESGRSAISMAGSITDSERLEAAVRRTEAEWGPLGLAVNAAGIAGSAPAESLDLEQWRSVIDVDLTGTFLSCQVQGRAMLRRGHGSIVNIASMSATSTHPGIDQAHYYSAKAGVKHLSAALATEWASRGVRVNSLSPGYTSTAMNQRPEVARQQARLAAQTPMNRFARPHEMVGPTVFLLSRAASYCTGIDLIVDGGYSAW